MFEHTCGECSWFRRFFVKNGGQPKLLDYGYCAYPRLEKQMCDAEACIKFKMSPDFTEKPEKIP